MRGAWADAGGDAEHADWERNEGVYPLSKADQEFLIRASATNPAGPTDS